MKRQPAETTRRNVLAGVMTAAVVAAGCVTSSPTRRRRLIGHTGITWGYSADNAPDAIRDAGELGFHGFESFGGVLENWQTRGRLADRLKAHNLPLIGAYCPMVLTNAAQRQQEVQKAVRWGQLIRSYGGRIAVIGPDNVDRQRFDFAAQRAGIISTLNDIGSALADIGVTAAVHQHTGSCITTRDETWAVMESVNNRSVKLCPDTGELLAAGIDPVTAIRHFGAIVAHVHVKDYDGGGRHDGYTPVGLGRVDVAAVMNALEALPGEFMVMAELNPDSPGNRADPTTPRRAALQSKGTFEALGYRFRGLASGVTGDSRESRNPASR
jgi:inosose dehydratase